MLVWMLIEMEERLCDMINQLRWVVVGMCSRIRSPIIFVLLQSAQRDSTTAKCCCASAKHSAHSVLGL
jgi:hypothetical protein